MMMEQDVSDKSGYKVQVKSSKGYDRLKYLHAVDGLNDAEVIVNPDNCCDVTYIQKDTSKYRITAYITFVNDKRDEMNFGTWTTNALWIANYVASHYEYKTIKEIFLNIYNG